MNFSIAISYLIPVFYKLKKQERDMN